MQGTVFNIQKFCLHDGPGVRTNIFLKGCMLECMWCHNPESKSFDKQIILHPLKCVKCGKCIEICPNGCISINNDVIKYVNTECSSCFLCVENCACGAISLSGELMSVERIIDTALEDKPFYDVSGGGITITGGEPLMQPDFTKEIIHKAKENGLHVCVETCGFADKKTALDVLQNADIVLFDIKDTDSKRHKEYTGKPCKRITDNLKTLDKHSIKTIMRCIMVKGINMEDSHYKNLAELLNSMENCIRAELIAYHSLASGKAKRLGIKLVQNRAWEPTSDEMNIAKSKIQKHLTKDIEVIISGEE